MDYTSSWHVIVAMTASTRSGQWHVRDTATPVRTEVDEGLVAVHSPGVPNGHNQSNIWARI